MNTLNNKIIGKTLSSALFIASVAGAQSNSNDNLLRLLGEVENKQREEVAVAPVVDEVIASPDAVIISEVSDAPEVSVNAEPVWVAASEPVVAEEIIQEEAVVEEVMAVEPVTDDALARVLQSVQAADERAALTEEVIDEVADLDVVTADDESVDDLGMASYENATVTSYDNLISVRLNKVGLEEAINLFAQLSGANIIVPELTEAAQISVNLKDVEWRPALQSILDSYNYELYQRVSGSNVYSVRRRPVGAPAPQVVETFKLNYATVPNVAALIRQLLPADAKVSEFASRNMIVVKSTESSLSEVRSILASIDTVRQQVYIESKFMELADGDQKDLGIDWQMLSSYGVGASLESATYGKENTVGTPSENIYNDSVPDSTASFAGDGEYSILTSVINADDFQLVMSALESSSGVSVVSNPKIIVANEELANISIITKEPNLKQNRQQSMNDTADTITYEMDPTMPYFTYGITLDVIPSINTSSNITVQINPALTRKVGDKKDDSAENEGNDLLSYPIIDEKEIKTIFSLSSGQTAAIGGLTENSEEEQTKKVPVLGNIPFIGRLFSWEHTVNKQSETIIFVTVGLANTQQINSETGLPEDADLSRRRVIKERNDRIMREQDRVYYQQLEDNRLEDSLKALKAREERQAEMRMRSMLKAQQKAAKEKQNAKELALN